MAKPDVPGVADVEAIVDGLAADSTGSEVWRATEHRSARAVATVAVQRSLSGGGGSQTIVLSEEDDPVNLDPGYAQGIWWLNVDSGQVWVNQGDTSAAQWSFIGPTSSVFLTLATVTLSQGGGGIYTDELNVQPQDNDNVAGLPTVTSRTADPTGSDGANNDVPGSLLLRSDGTGTSGEVWIKVSATTRDWKRVMTGPAAFVANGSTVDQLRDALINAGMMEPS